MWIVCMWILRMWMMSKFTAMGISTRVYIQNEARFLSGFLINAIVFVAFKGDFKARLFPLYLQFAIAEHFWGPGLMPPEALSNNHLSCTHGSRVACLQSHNQYHVNKNDIPQVKSVKISRLLSVAKYVSLQHVARWFDDLPPPTTVDYWSRHGTVLLSMQRNSARAPCSAMQRS